jgi:Flp pilus assembly protein TadG
MRLLPTSRVRLIRRRRLSLATLLRDEKGSAALEFAIVAMPFLLFVLGLLGIGLYLLANHSLQYGVEAAARKIRTGEAEKGRMTVGQFRQLVCREAGAFIDCGKLSVIVQHGGNWSGVSPQACVDRNNKQTQSTGSANDQLTSYSGSASEVVLVTLCYSWELAKYFDFLKFGSGSGGAGPTILQAATAFKSEPYNL